MTTPSNTFPEALPDSHKICYNEFEKPDSAWNPPCTLEVEYWNRTPECAAAKDRHVQEVDSHTSVSREELVLNTTLLGVDIALERNMFPYNCPKGIEHWTLWSKEELRHSEICEFLESWCLDNAPEVIEWNYEENTHRSFDIPHVHVFLRSPILDHPPARPDSPKSVSLNSPDNMSVLGSDSLAMGSSTCPLQLGKVSNAEQAIKSKRTRPLSALVSDEDDEDESENSESETSDRGDTSSASSSRNGAKRKRCASSAESAQPEERNITLCQIK